MFNAITNSCKNKEAMNLLTTEKITTNKDIYTMCMFIDIKTNSYFNKNGIVILGVFKKKNRPQIFYNLRNGGFRNLKIIYPSIVFKLKQKKSKKPKLCFST